MSCPNILPDNVQAISNNIKQEKDTVPHSSDYTYLPFSSIASKMAHLHGSLPVIDCINFGIAIIKATSCTRWECSLGGLPGAESSAGWMGVLTGVEMLPCRHHICQSRRTNACELLTSILMAYSCYGQQQRSSLEIKWRCSRLTHRLRRVTSCHPAGVVVTVAHPAFKDGGVHRMPAHRQPGVRRIHSSVRPGHVTAGWCSIEVIASG